LYLSAPHRYNDGDEEDVVEEEISDLVSAAADAAAEALL
jgi:hypothetical protein